MLEITISYTKLSSSIYNNRILKLHFMLLITLPNVLIWKTFILQDIYLGYLENFKITVHVCLRQLFMSRKNYFWNTRAPLRYVIFSQGTRENIIWKCSEELFLSHFRSTAFTLAVLFLIWRFIQDHCRVAGLTWMCHCKVFFHLSTCCRLVGIKGHQ